jgi:hypothetical protein
VANYSLKVNLVPGIDKLVAASDGVKSAELVVAEAIAQAAIAIAPVGTAVEHDRHPGEYRDGIAASATADGAQVVASAPHSAFVEFGVPGRGIAPQPVFHSAAASLGLTVG